MRLLYTFLITSFPAAASLCGFTFLPESWATINKVFIVAVVSIIFTILVFLYERRGKITFNENSKKFYSFFTEWYKQAGVLHIYCVDLEWMDTDMINAIKSKKGKANIFLRDVGGSYISELKSNGVNVFEVDPKVNSHYRFSVIDNEEIKKIIIRNKEEENKKISFLETTANKDPYLISIALDLLNYCKK